MEAVLTHIADYLGTQSWQIALLIAAVALACWALRNRSAHVRYLLWLLVLAKCLTPPVLPVHLAVLPVKTPATAVVASIPAVPREEAVTNRPVPEGPRPMLPATSPAAPLPPRLDMRLWFAFGWLAGAILFLCAAGMKTAWTIRWLRRERRTLPPHMQSPIAEIFRSLHVTRPPRVWLIEDIGQPFVWGILRGDIYLPQSFAQTGSDKHQRNILAHEIGHVLRFDAAVNSLQLIAQAIFWFHPLVWWANQRIRREREQCCDEMAIAHLNAQPKDYSTAILNILIQAQESTRPVPSLAVAGPVKNLEERIKTMLKPGKQFHRRPSLTVVAVVVTIALLAVPTTVVFSARTEPQPKTPSADKPATDAWGYQPRYAARTFNSQMAFSVWVMVDHSGTWGVGNTPSATPLEIPPCWCWGVSTRSPVKDWDLLAREISLNKIPGLSLDSCTDSDLKHLAGLRDLRLLHLPETAITDAGLESLEGLTELEELGLENTSVTDAGLAHLKSLTKLRVLYLAKTRITDAGLQYLEGLTDLWGLDLNETQITDAGLQHLAGLTKLGWLRLNGTRVTDAGLEHLKGLTALGALQLGDTQVTARGFAHLKALPGLFEVNLGSRTITDDADLANLVDSLPRLTRLNLGGSPITDAGLAHIRRLTGLHHLVLLGTQITDAGLANIESLTELQYLLLGGTRITDAGLEHLKGLSKLSALGLERTQITDAGLKHLQGLKGIGKLYLNDTRIGDVGLEHLQGLTTLFWLDLTGTQITDAGLQHLQNLTKLSALGLVGTGITDAGLKRLRGLTSLHDLALLKTQVTDAGVQQLKQSLPNATIYADQAK